MDFDISNAASTWVGLILGAVIAIIITVYQEASVKNQKRILSKLLELDKSIITLEEKMNKELKQEIKDEIRDVRTRLEKMDAILEKKIQT